MKIRRILAVGVVMGFAALATNASATNDGKWYPGSLCRLDGDESTLVSYYLTTFSKAGASQQVACPVVREKKSADVGYAEIVVAEGVAKRGCSLYAEAGTQWMGIPSDTTVTDQGRSTVKWLSGSAVWSVNEAAQLVFSCKVGSNEIIYRYRVDETY